MADYLWFFIVGIAPFLLAGLIIYALMRRRKLTSAEKVARDEKTRQLYEDNR
ncbi:hypothetical protein [Chelativorans sp. Marseille-P2723]|uniref:hypothetical protein n=1 Tax=Chelativorans sp. Marseille-P2723 TaxID=2709133 RepID=UPI00156ED3D1|nr:hypothetical protein [Chelativorans sp. Marseille-P2723]